MSKGVEDCAGLGFEEGERGYACQESDKCDTTLWESSFSAGALQGEEVFSEGKDAVGGVVEVGWEWWAWRRESGKDYIC